jgi:outer membrane lipoprotein-sorting protein
MIRIPLSARSIPFCLVLVIGTLPLAARGAETQETLDRYAQPALQDLSATAVVAQKSDPALKQIGDGFEKGYRIGRSSLKLKEPGKVRVEGKYSFFSVVYVINGDKKLTSVPTLHIHKVKNIATRPGERQTSLDIGFFTPSLLPQLSSQFVRYETRGGKRLAVFDLWFKAEPGGRKHTVWIDPATRTIVERQVFHRRGGLKMRYLYQNPTRYAEGVWLPTRVDLYNAAGQQAAVTRYDDVRVNAGLSDSLFQF